MIATSLGFRRGSILCRDSIGIVSSSPALSARLDNLGTLGASIHSGLFDRPSLTAASSHVTLGVPARREFNAGFEPSAGVVNLATSGYLGFGNDTRVKAAAHAALDRFGTHTGGCRLLSGTTDLHFELEERLAHFLNAEAVVTYSSGYVTNVSVIPALFGPGDLVILDRHAHRSLYDGAILSRATLRRFAHNNLDHLERILRRTSSVRRRLIAVDGVYSMEGTIAPVPELVRLAQGYGAFLLVDEAHAIGVLGENGRGIVSHFRLPADAIDIRIGTMSKALAASGGFAAVRSEVSALLRYGSAGRVFSAGMTPADTAAALASVEIVQQEPHHVDRLRRNVRRLRTGLAARGIEVLGDQTAIVPVPVNDQLRTLEAASTLLRLGFFVNPVIAPGVPVGTERLRCLVSALHDPSDLDAAADAIAESLNGNSEVEAAVADRSAAAV